MISRLLSILIGDVFGKRIEVKRGLWRQSVMHTTNKWYNAQQLAETCWLYLVWCHLGDSSELVLIHNPLIKLDNDKREVITARFYKIPAGTIQNVAS